MRTAKSSSVTQLLFDWSQGDKQALDQLMPLVYPELRKLAGRYLRKERPDHILQPTALIHEAYVRLMDQDLPQWQGRTHFYGIASRLMRQILVDYARARTASRRSGAYRKLSLDEAPPTSLTEDPEGLLAFDEALTRLCHLDERKCRIIEMRSFGGMSMSETAAALGISEPTIKRELRFAKAWLRRELRLRLTPKGAASPNSGPTRKLPKKSRGAAKIGLVLAVIGFLAG
jgi:RNA polymerase sigma factor (TIGR02999 family)